LSDDRHHMRRHTSRYRVQIYDIDAYGDLSSPSLLRFLQQTASDASAAVGFDVEWYERHGTLWVIRRTVVEVAQPARYRDQLAVDTWVSDIRRVRSQREYEVRLIGADEVVARGWSDWVYVDVNRGRPIRAPEAMCAALMPDGVVAQPREARPVEPPPACAFRTERRVEFDELDSVAHVNNANYAGYVEQDLWDALAASGWRIDPFARVGRLRLVRHDLEYLASAEYRDRLQGVTWVTEQRPDGFTSAHLIERDGARILHARSEWRWQGGPMPPPLRAAVAALGFARGP